LPKSFLKSIYLKTILISFNEITKYQSVYINWDFYETEEQDNLYHHASHHKHGNNHASHGKHDKG
jgi:hypothetical protein